MKKPTKSQFGFKKKLSSFNNKAYLSALSEWEKSFNDAAAALIKAEEVLNMIKAQRPRKSSFKVKVSPVKWDEKSYLKAIEAYENRPRIRAGGRPRTNERAIHESWIPFLGLLDPGNPYKSANAFCDEIGLLPSTFSAMQMKEIKPTIAAAINQWAQGKEVKGAK